jgi:hypothetical protein
MVKPLDLVGQRFERLVVVGRAGSTTHGKALWRCVCDCGGDTAVPSGDLRSGTTRSCGCLHRETVANIARPKPRPVADRFWPKVEKTDGCWLWTGATDRRGYGKIFDGAGKLLIASRVAHELCIGPIPDGLCVLHKCDNPPCVNPDHLFLGTFGDNTQDMLAKGRNRNGYSPPRS